ncbi:hypothetical protein ACA910_004151 [Epithemia clementina (nom. ined.)]
MNGDFMRDANPNGATASVVEFGFPPRSHHHQTNHHRGGVQVSLEDASKLDDDDDEEEAVVVTSQTKRTASPNEINYRNGLIFDSFGSSSSTTNITTTSQVAPQPTLPRHSRESVLQRLSEALLRRSLTKMDLSQRGLQASDARLVKMALLQNAHLTVLKLGYNNLENYGACLLADGIRKHDSLESLDLGFNNIGDEGCIALANAIAQSTTSSATSPPLRTLYLAGNLIGQDGAMGLADALRRGSCLQRLYLTGNRLGPEGVCAITEAIEEGELRLSEASLNEELVSPLVPDKSRFNGHKFISNTSRRRKIFQEHKQMSREIVVPTSSGLEELFLGGTSMGSQGCRAVARLLRVSSHLRVISLPNCDLTDDDVAELSASLKASRDKLPLQSLQLSFNQITSKGVEHVVNAVWGSGTLKELLIDNNEIADRGAQQLATVLPFVESLEQIDVGFNGIKSVGMKLFMAAVAESKKLKTLSLSGNTLDSSSAKAIAYALATNRSLVSLNLVHCSTDQTVLRQIAAGIVSNSKIGIRDLMGFQLGPLVVSLGFPPVLGHYSNEQVLNFLHTMWEKFGGSAGDDNMNDDPQEDQIVDPLHFLPGSDSATTNPRFPPLPASTVLEVAKKAFDSLVQEGYDVFSRRPGHPKENSVASSSPFFRNRTFVMETPDGLEEEDDTSSSSEPHNNNDDSNSIPSNNARSFVAAPEMATTTTPEESLPNPERKKRIVEWLCKNIQNLNKLAQQPFSSAELWRLHQHYFTPVVNESGGSVTHHHSAAMRQQQQQQAAFINMAEPGSNLVVSSVPEVSRASSTDNPSDDASGSREDIAGPISDPSMKQSPTALGSFSLLKRKVSYRFLGDAALSFPTTGVEHHRANSVQPQKQSSHQVLFSITTGTAGGSGVGHASSSMPRKSKRARRNRSRISFLPRIKAKLESQLDVCHENALVVMRQLFYVEQAILRGEVNPINPSRTTRTHLSADFAADAEMIIMDMI